MIQSIFSELTDFCISSNDLRERYYSNRGKKLEKKIEKVFRKFFNNQATIYNGYYTQDGHEQDLLILFKGMALIIEAKASKRDEPRREPDKSYPLIVSNFNETIQKGYDQAFRVKEKFIDREVIRIYSDQNLKNHIIDIKTKNFHKAFTIIVTLERFGQIQTDLNDLLDIFDDDTFPWSVCIDDLEVFLLQMKKQNMNNFDLLKFLNIRERLHSKLITADELEVCGAFLQQIIKLNNTINGDEIFTFTPDLTDIFDNSYHKGGLGFDNEKNLDVKRSGKYIPLGGF